MEKLCKIYIKLLIAGTLSFSGASPAFGETTSVQPDPEKGLKAAIEIVKICKETNKSKTQDEIENLCTLENAYAMQTGNGAKGACTDDTAKAHQKDITDAMNEAEKACAGLVDDDAAEAGSASLKSCTKLIDKCDQLRGEVNRLDPEETKSEDHTDALMQFANNTQLQQMGIQIPTQKKTEPIADEEKDYYNKCPLMSEESYTTQLKALEDKKDKIKEDIAKKKKEIIESMAKANKDMADYNKKKAERADTARKAQADAEKEISRINEDFTQKTNELAKTEGEMIKQRNNVDAEYNALEKMRAKLAVDLSGISVELSGACKGKYHEMLAKVPMANRRVLGAAAAVESRDYKLAFMKRCVRDQWFEVKQKYDKIKAELNSLKSEKENSRKMIAQINNERQQRVAFKAKEDQQVAQREQSRLQSAMETEQQAIEEAKRTVQQGQQTTINLQGDITNLETLDAKTDKRIILLGKKPTGKMTLNEARSAIGVLKNRTSSAQSYLEGSVSLSCKTMLTSLTGKAQEALSANNKAAPGSGQDQVAVHDSESQK